MNCNDENIRLRAALADIREVWAGSDGTQTGEFVPETAPEAYLKRLVTQCYMIATAALQEDRMSEWISVQDKLPEPAIGPIKNQYLVHIPPYNYPFIITYMEWPNFGGWQYDHVAHWMPLPPVPDTCVEITDE